MLAGKSFDFLLWPRKGSLMKTQTLIFDNRLYYTRKIELHRKGKKSCTVRITQIVISVPIEISVLITVRRIHYSKMGKVPTTLLQWSVSILSLMVASCFILRNKHFLRARITDAMISLLVRTHKFILFIEITDQVNNSRLHMENYVITLTGLDWLINLFNYFPSVIWSILIQS